MHKWTLITFVNLLICLVITTASTGQITATVNLRMTDKNDLLIRTGTGFFVTDSLIATNAHVIKDAAAGTASLVGTENRSVIEDVVTVDPNTDIVLLRVSIFGAKPLQIGDSDSVKVGDTVNTLMSPIKGIIERRDGIYTEEHFKINVPISPRHSGAPVLNNNGEVIGICFKPDGKLNENNFVIPSNTLVELLHKTRQKKPLWDRNLSRNLSVDFFINPVWCIPN